MIFDVKTESQPLSASDLYHANALKRDCKFKQRPAKKKKACESCLGYFWS